MKICMISVPGTLRQCFYGEEFALTAGVIRPGLSEGAYSASSDPLAKYGEAISRRGTEEKVRDGRNGKRRESRREWIGKVDGGRKRGR